MSILLLENDYFDAGMELDYLRSAGINFVRTGINSRRVSFPLSAAKPFDVILADHLPEFYSLQALSIACNKALRTPFSFVSRVLQR